ncbi:MAG: peptidoglycan-binding protein [Candidatus Omnitrophica bacterium CG_4_10_14_0_2_um_filter_44_9]|nr:MAG: peptidoglycan-binding protein [Candidatus Omnitrophica bacterium CG_4_10_14_0_8_um_filter_44_12]PIZ84692.1 MAG: peptidoglycan-binding protein [Candidatus Omnitrophica bacterium CG_4_10_14_0_2_um_filter_44_9]
MIQQALKNLGLYSGEVDGSIGPKTKEAIKEFQSKNSLAADGKVGPKTWAALKNALNTSSAD